MTANASGEAVYSALPGDRPRAAFLVPNPCNPDHRVVKQAEFLAAQGYHVRIFCFAKDGVPHYEVVNGVEYRRFTIKRNVVVLSLIKGWLLRPFSWFGTKNEPDLADIRNDNLKELDRLRKAS